jgi:hypothetical protein
MPPVAADAYAVLAASIVEQLSVHDRLEPILAAIAPHVTAANGELTEHYISFRPGVPLAIITQALGWNSAVAYSSDVHMSSWDVYPRADYDERKEPHVGRWRVGVHLAGWPRSASGELPELEDSGPSSVYDVRTCDTLVSSLSFERLL